MKIKFIAGFAAISADPSADSSFYIEALKVPLVREGDGSEYWSTDEVPGAKHFGVWSLADAAESCFGSREWPHGYVVPQATIEFEVDDVSAAAAELEAQGYRLIHPTRVEPWGQTVARLQAPNGLLVGVTITPWMN